MFNIIDRLDLSEDQKCELLKKIISQNPLAVYCIQLGLTPLHYAVMKNLPKIVKTLLELGCPVNAIEEFNHLTPLHLAAEQGFSDLIFLLGYYHCDFNCVDKSQETALHKAIINKHPACVTSLLVASDFKIDKTLRNNNGHTAEDLLRQLTDIKSQAALANAFTTCPDLFNRTPLHLAVINNVSEQVQRHLNLGAPINAQDCDGKTALHFAVLCNHSAILLQLCYHDQIDMNTVDKDGNTALHKSIEKGHPEAAKILVTSKTPASKTIRNKAQLTAAELIPRHKEKEAFVLQKALSSTRVSNGQSLEMEKEVFNFELFGTSNLTIFLKEHFKELEVSIKTLIENKESPRRYSDGSVNKLLKRKQPSPRVKSHSLFHELSTPIEKARCLDTIEAAYHQCDGMSVINKIKANPTQETLDKLLNELHHLVRKNPNTKTGFFVQDLLDELQFMLVGSHELFEKKKEALESQVHKRLLAEGLKKICSTDEITKISKDTLRTLGQQEEHLNPLEILATICSGESISPSSVVINLNKIMLSVLGLLDTIEPVEIIRYLIALNPLFSKIQKLQSHYIALRLIEFSIYYGYSPSESPFGTQLDRYLKTCCDEAMQALLTTYKNELDEFKKNPLFFFVEQLRGLLTPEIEPAKDLIKDKINQFVSQNSINIKHNKTLLACVEYIAREFNTINTRFYQTLLLKELRQNYWENDQKKKPPSPLTEHSKLTDGMSQFIKESVVSFTNPQKQAQAMTLFILVARESLHNPHGADMLTLMATVCAFLKLEQMAPLKEAFTLLDKNTLLIKEALSRLTSPFDNFKYYRDLLAAEPYVLPLLEVMLRDKIHIYERFDLYQTAPMLGKIHLSLLVIKKSLSALPLVSRSDLGRQLEQPQKNSPHDTQSADKYAEDLSSDLEASPKKQTTPRKTSNNAKSNSQRKGLSLRKPSAEKEPSRKDARQSITLFSSSAPSSIPQREQDINIEKHSSLL